MTQPIKTLLYLMSLRQVKYVSYDRGEIMVITHTNTYYYAVHSSKLRITRYGPTISLSHCTPTEFIKVMCTLYS